LLDETNIPSSTLFLLRSHYDMMDDITQQIGNVTEKIRPMLPTIPLSNNCCNNQASA